MSIVICSGKTGKCFYWKFFLQELDQEFRVWDKIFENFDSNPLTCDPFLFPGKNNLNIVKGNHIFSGKGERRSSLNFDISGWSFSALLPIYFDFGHLHGKQKIKVGPKLPTLGPLLFHKNLNPSKVFQAMSLFARVLPLMRISVILDPYFGGIRD